MFAIFRNGCILLASFCLAITLGGNGYAQTLTGPSSATAGNSANYTLTDDVLYSNPVWVVVNGTVTATSQSGVNYNATVRWDCAGSNSVTFKNGSTTIASKAVTVTCPLVSPPFTTFTYTTQCTGVVITRNSNPFGGLVWYWQTDPNGTSTSLGSQPSLTVTTSGTYYLRSRASTAPCCWGTSLATDPVTVTLMQAPTVTPASRCGTGTVILQASSSQEGTTIRWYTASSGGTYVFEGSAYTTPSISATTTYYAAAYNTTSACESSRVAITATVNSVPAAPTSAISAPGFLCGPGSATLSSTGAGAGEGYRWYDVASGGTPLSSTTQALSVTKTFYAAKYITATGCEGTRLAVNVPVYPVPVISHTGPDAIPYGATKLLSTGTAYSYQWLRDGANISGATQLSYTAAQPGVYTVSVKSTSTASACLSATLEVKAALASQPAGANWTSTARILKPGVTAATSLYTLQPQEITQVIAYEDGLGRPFQTIAVGSSPLKGDIVQAIGYGQQGLVDTTYIPYTIANADGRIRLNALQSGTGYSGSEQKTFYQNTAFVVSDNFPFAVQKYKQAPDVRIIEQGAPGSDWQPGTGHTTKSDILLNTTNQVRYWKPDGTTNSYHPVKTVIVQQVTNENGHKVKTFIDKRGNIILKQVQLDETVESLSTPWLQTYYIYDNFGHLKYQLPPKAVAKLGTGSSLNANSATVAELIYKYTYDTRGRLVERKVPGAAAQYRVYDKLDRLVLVQDGNLRASNQWIFIKYDLDNRPVYTGLYTNTVETTRAAVQALFDSRNYDTEPYYDIEEVNASYHGYSNRVFPTTGLTLLAVNYYDHYDFDRNGTADYSYSNNHLAGQETGASGRTRGLPTATKQVIVSPAGITSNWLTQVVFYDAFDRPIQTLQNNHLYLTLADKQTVIYDFSGKVLKTKMSQFTSASAVTDVTQRVEYDHAGRVVNVFHTTNVQAEQLLANYQYNALGQLIDKKLHHTGSNNFLQSIDYRYSIRGWLKSINNAELSINGANNDESNDYFGMELLYNTVESAVGNTAYYNGNISALKWKGMGAAGAADQRSYKYTYDKSNKLKTSVFQANNGTAWTKEPNTLNETMTYDHNGNLLTLQRNQNLRGLSGITVTSSPQAIDNLTYTYMAVGENRLAKVEDATGLAVGFDNDTTATTEYTYDNAGNITADHNKGISSVVNNFLGKPQEVNFDDGRKIEYTYDASGAKLTMKSYQGTTLLSTTDYVKGFVYENNTLSFFGSPEGRVVKNGSTMEYQYAMSDHQGNTRVVFSSATPAPQPVTANFEASTNADFQNYPGGGARSSWELFDHTDVSGSAYTYSQLLNGGNNSQVGVAKGYKVYPGDKVKIEAYAKYYNPQGSGDLSGFATSLTAAFGVTPASTGEAALAYQALNTYGSFIAAGNGGGTTSFPKAFVTILLFDKDHKFLDVAYEQIDGGEQDGITPKAAHDYMTREYTVKEAGYAYVYLSNENPTYVEVYFDDVTITHTKTNVIQYNEYYPFGLQTATSWTRENSANNYLYNSGAELNSVNGWYETFFRSYDPALGRFMQIDPMADIYSNQTPYNYANNDPVFWNDPNGDVPGWEGGDDGHKPERPRYKIMHLDPTNYGHDEDFWMFDTYGQATTVYYGMDAEQRYWYNKTYDPMTGGYYYDRPYTGKEMWEGKEKDAPGIISTFVKLDLAQQDWEPMFVNGSFGELFKQKFGLLTFMPGGYDEEQAIRHLEKRLTRTANNFEYYLIPDPTSPQIALRPVSYLIQIGDNTLKYNLVDISSLNNTTIWGNPGSISPGGTPTPMEYTLDDGTVVRLTIFFQRPFAF